MCSAVMPLTDKGGGGGGKSASTLLLCDRMLSDHMPGMHLGRVFSFVLLCGDSIECTGN